MLRSCRATDRSLIDRSTVVIVVVLAVLVSADCLSMVNDSTTTTSTNGIYILWYRKWHKA